MGFIFIVVAILLFVLGILSSFLRAYVVLQIADMYGLNFILDFGFIGVLGIIFIVSLLTYSPSKSINNTNDIWENIGTILSPFLNSLMAWFFAWLIYAIMF